MAEISKSGVASLSTLGLDAVHKISGLICGESIAPGDACYINTDGKLYRADGSAVAAAAKVRGIAMKAGDNGEAVTLMRTGRMRYGSGLTPGDTVYLSGTVLGGLADAASTGGTTPLGFAIDGTRIEFDIPTL